VCWRLLLGAGSPKHYLKCITLAMTIKNNSGIHVQNVQVCYTGIRVP
uniref:Uncharacterized protein n=1 Tax=Macaca fascicularis TaxID=9541 RepID=A0A7N9CYJ5_MACFA